MHIHNFNDNEVENIAKANIDAFLADCRTEAGQVDIAKSVMDFRAAQQVDREWNSFVEDLELPASSGRSGTLPRLRSERLTDHDAWRPGDPVEKGLNSDPLATNGADRRKDALRGWFASQLALGKSANELIQHADQHDQRTANVLRELAAELGNE